MMMLRPVTLKEAQEFLSLHHTLYYPPHSHKFSIGLEDNRQLIGVVTVGLPTAHANNDGYTAEVTRCCVLDGKRNANSKLYAAALRAARAMGYRRIITYTLPEESGASLEAVGFSQAGMTQWRQNDLDIISGISREKPSRYPIGPKVRWVRYFGRA